MNVSTTSTPFVSFCFTTYKRGAILKSTLESIRRQTFQDFEVIVSDNDPEGSAQWYVESFSDVRFKYFNNGANLGMKPSFNKSLERSSGQYIVMIADDDPVYPDMLEVLVHLKEKYPGYGMYMGGCDWFCADREVARLYKLKVGTNSCISSDHDLNFIRTFTTIDFIKTLFSFGIFSHYLWSTCMVKREVLINMGGIPDYGTPFLGDFAYMSIASTQEGCVVINKALGCQTIHKENFGRNQNDQLPIVVQRFPEYLESKLSHLPGWPSAKAVMLRFLGLWITGHMAFLHHFYRRNGMPDNGLAEAERAVLKFEPANVFRKKYFLKKRFPQLHDLIVRLKRSVSPKLKSDE